MWWDLWSTFKKVLKFPNLCCLPELKSLSPHIQTCRTRKDWRILTFIFSGLWIGSNFFQRQSHIKRFSFLCEKRTFCVDLFYVANFTKQSMQQFDSLNFIINLFSTVPIYIKNFLFTFLRFKSGSSVRRMNIWFFIKELASFLFWIYLWEKWCLPLFNF